MNPSAWEALLHLRPRVRKVREALAYQLADQLRRDVADALGKAPAEENYGADLRVRRVRTGRAQTGYAVVQRVRAGFAANLAPDTTVVYVARKRWAGGPTPITDVLVAHNPWPLDMLPTQPSPKEAVLRYRRVTREEVTALRQRRTADATAWRVALAKVGVRPAPVVFDARTRAIPDAVFHALRLEFGSSRTRAVPAWRPALRLVAWRARMILRRRTTRDVLWGPPRKTRRLIPRLPALSKGTLTGLQPFVDRLG